MENERLRICHFDLDCFFASVEQLEEPSLAGKPVVVGAAPGERGVVSTANYEARAFGVRSAMPIGTAQRLCPQAVFLRPRHSLYRQYSRRVFAVVDRFAARVQPVSVDEAFLVMEGDDPVAVARDLKAAIRAETGLVASLGLAACKLVAKVASDHGKPDGFVVVAPGGEAAFLAPLPVRVLWGVGPKTAARLGEMGIGTVGELAVAPPERLAEAFGRRQAALLRQYALGIDRSPVVLERGVRSISEEITFQNDIADGRVLWQALRAQCGDCAARLRAAGFVARTVTIKLRYADFRTATRSVTLAVPTDDEREIAAAVIALMRRSWAADRRPLRLVGTRVSGLLPCPELRQPPLL